MEHYFEINVAEKGRWVCKCGKSNRFESNFEGILSCETCDRGVAVRHRGMQFSAMELAANEN